MKTPVLFIVIPCYNEQEALPITAKRLTELTDDMLARGIIDPESCIVLVDDGSRDATWQVISDLHAADGRFEGVKLAHNAGHMNALWAGMTLSAERCDCVITIDADLQDDVNAMYGFLEEYRNGADVGPACAPAGRRIPSSSAQRPRVSTNSLTGWAWRWSTTTRTTDCCRSARSRRSCPSAR